MGNQMSVPQRAEDQENDSESDIYKVSPGGERVQNGMIISTYTVQLYDEVDLGISVKEDNVATSSPKTMEISTALGPNGQNLGKEAKPEAPAAKSRFFVTLSRPVPGRTGDQATDSSTGSVKLDVSSSNALGNKEPSENMALPVAAARGHDPDKTPGQTPAQHEGFSATWEPAPLLSESEGAAPSKPKDSSFFDKLFKLDKGREKAPINHQQEAKLVERQGQSDEIPGLLGQPDDAPAERDIVEAKGKGGRDTTPVGCDIPGDSGELETTKEDLQTSDIPENNNSIMSFFKTLVSPNKTEAKKDLEDTASKIESVCDGQAGQQTSEIQAKGTKKKHLHSPRLGLTFRKFFRHKSAEKAPATSDNLKSDKANFVPQETQGAAKNPTSPETAKEGAKEKGGPTSLPLSKLFWKKSVKEDSVPTGAEHNVVCESPVEVIKSEEVNSALQTVDLNEERDATAEPTDVKLKREDRNPPRTSLMTLLRQMTSDSTEKAITPPEPEPVLAVQKGKEGSAKDKKATAEMNRKKSNKPEAKEPAPCAEPAVVEANSLQGGNKPPKRPEKRRPSLGGFLKGLGPKRMLDAQVQTDPVSIGPVGKSKQENLSLSRLKKMNYLGNSESSCSLRRKLQLYFLILCAERSVSSPMSRRSGLSQELSY
ncbi:PREDICTED: breast carcinoma-amplified sequence 1 isoform X2 [Hipposideros armiger]|uniref:Breast carcinoma-amplified sequence 1 isoform X2 n=1 Tax=Hipposideros armiger TaxID=186990 RepID=A0A8B7R763_HIPAR|nr:PREDICTED: breast carcinoma-amplified sequence 1 isoform X2 [Hipposideros armiger]